MKKTTLLTIIFCFAALPLYSQSVLTLQAGTTMGVLSGADLCANIINGPGLLYGGGTICGEITAIQQPANELPAKYSLSQNYPNPFNPSTVIQYQLPKEDFISIKVFDELGRLAAVLFEGKQQPGNYSAEFDGKNFASGIYYCRITTDNLSANNGQSFTKVIKMSLIK